MSDSLITNSTDSGCIVVGIGASAGGLVPLQKFFEHMPANSGFAFVVIQHLSPDFKSMMSELLASRTKMQIQVAIDGMAVKPNNIYLIPSRNEMVIMNGRLYLKQITAADLGVFLPINTFFISLAREMRHKSAAIIFSGAGSDGTLGIQEISKYKGIILVQDHESSQFSSMPDSARQTGLQMQVLQVEQMPDALISHFQRIEEKQKLAKDEVVESLNIFTDILDILEASYQIDFNQYKTPTLVRRIERRMLLTNIETPIEYLEFLREDSVEVDNLYRDLLVDVTHFFRDKQAFAWLEKNIVPKIVSQKEDGEHIRIWVAACASGEEAYSLASLFYEEILKQQKLIQLRVFATDAHEESIQRASKGQFSPETMTAIPSHIKKYFKAEGEYYQVDKTLRNTIVFAQQNLLKDAIFTNLDMVSCRNLLIYLQPETQKKVLSQFHFALKVNGILFLGPSEHLGDLKPDFSVLNQEWRIFEKISSRTLIVPTHFQELKKTHTNSRATKAGKLKLNDREPWEKPLINNLISDGVLIDKQHKIVQIFGNASQYLRFASGPIELDIKNLLIEPLITPIRSALYRLQSNPKLAHSEKTAFKFNDEFVSLKIATQVIGKDLSQQSHNPIYYLIRFETINVASSENEHEREELSQGELGQIATLQQELEFTRESLQSTLEEVETTNEELQSANEELLSSNEELQSTNEELQSVNEELYTVNTEYRMKNGELVDLNNDMLNLQRSSKVLTIFLDEELNIRNYTPSIGELFGFLPQDIGRPIFHLSSFIALDSEKLKQFADDALNGKPTTIEIRATHTKKLLLMEVMPFITDMNGVEGIILQFTDLTYIRELETEKREFEDLLVAVGKASPTVNMLFDIEKSEYVFVSDQFQRVLGISLEDALKNPDILQDQVHPTDARDFEEIISQTNRLGLGEITRYEGRFKHKNGHYVWLLFQCVVYKESLNGRAAQILITITDISELKDKTAALQEATQRLSTINNNIPAWISYIDKEYRMQYANRYYEEIFEVPIANLPGKHLKDVIGEELFAMNKGIFYDQALAGKEIKYQREIHVKGAYKGVADIRLIPDYLDGKVVGFYVVGMNVKEAYEAQREAEKYRALSEQTLEKVKADLSDRELFLLDIGEIIAGLFYRLSFVDAEKEVFYGRLLKVLGYENDGITPFNETFLTQIVHPDNQEQVRKFISEKRPLSPIKEPERFEIQLKHKDGHYLWYEIVYTVSKFDEEGNISEILLQLRDINKSKLLTQSVQIQRDYFDDLLSNTIPMIAIHEGPEHVFSFTNDAHNNSFENNRIFVGKSLLEAIPEFEEQNIKGLFDQVYQTGETLLLREKNSKVIVGDSNKPVEVFYYQVLAPIKNIKGDVTGIINIIFDLTELEQALDNLKLPIYLNDD